MDERALWDERAEEWARWIGDDGDDTRRFLTDPVLWRLLGEVRGKRALDAGCGTGYLTLKLAARGARTIGVDRSPRMIERARLRARQKGVQLDYRVDDCQALGTVPDRSVELCISNFVLMDLDDMDAAVRSMARVLAPSGRAVCVVLHPAFLKPAGRYDREQVVLEQWGPFAAPFAHHHRPLSRYLNAFADAGLLLERTEEPMVSDPPPQELGPEQFVKARERPFVILFALRKGAG
jgi:SAM-dependent methyltransferase